ncbi:DNA-directed RNA polymerases I and III subunit RPAC2 [Drepanopeziza brunnea f. sp. 'multigermtubi' MB_m1]|uniref:DNA-directed RNA polymerases I and III subunit RPAC2 n=1 Tax=Marssonina brunnea f. sp. multigermtubi (strain MB_m1) TaxID=1072389 RepID=K1WJJ6_MARBU|nr:DNA-directed RNA polymerases I and III subunit RPAC2 [Drepanopeziza brunnea f. sp. 'multigermtubi' MB_m1]EKD17855.1 DNA-directed RNA polymerases I and III subunit RPAC2 [Drepanopeziza brunnea f. sp. 'multigermtubi' MB_m1]
MPPKKSTAVAVDDPAADDVSMTDAPAAEDGTPAPQEKPWVDEKRIRILPGSSDTAASFEFKKEDHTLGNSLRYIIMKNPNVEFCGYSIPHPSEELMNIRIQTYEGTTAVAALDKGFQDLMDLCDEVALKFMQAREDFDGAKD